MFVKFEEWDSNLFSTAGKAELIQCTASPMVLYWSLAYHLPTSVLHKLEKTCADFFWGGSFHKINWELLCRSKLEGGIGLRLFKDLRQTSFNLVAMDSTT